MKQKTKLLNWIPSGILALILAGSASTALAQLDVATFDTDVSAISSTGGNTPSTNAWDSTGNPGGSAYIACAWVDKTGWQDVQINFNQTINVSSYDKIECDIKVDVANSQLTDSGDYGGYQLIMQNWSGGQGWTTLGSGTIANSSGWQHFSAGLSAYSGSCNQIIIAPHVNQYGTAPHAGTIRFWLDNVRLTSAIVYPPPTLNAPKMAPKEKGLTLLPATTSQYQRVMVYPNTTTYGTSLGWYNSANFPVSYSFMITNFPNLNNYTAQVFWMPNAYMQWGQADTSIDWNITNSLVFTISGNDSNPPTGWGVTMACKTNHSGANPNVTITNYAYGQLPVGRWTVKFLNNTDFTITAPDLSEVNGSLTPDQLDLISGNSLGNTAMTPYLGIQNNALNCIGVPAVFGNIEMSNVLTNGVNGIIYDDFTADAGVLNTNMWNKLTDNTKDITVNNGLLYYLSWNMPNDVGYGPLQATTSLLGSWVDFSPASDWLVVNGTNRTATITTADMASKLGATDVAFFRLIKRSFNGLQVLLPGETAAPGTLTGKTGTPTAADTVNVVNVTVNSVDTNGWYLIPATDTIAITSSDTAAIMPNNAALVNGTGTYLVLFQTTGSWTVTATDVTTNAIPAATSAPVTVN